MSDLEEEVQEKVAELMKELSDNTDTLNEAIKGISATQTGAKSYTWKNESGSQAEALLALERWYNSAFPLVSEYLPDRRKEFEDRYQELTKALEVDLSYIRENDINSEGSLKMVINNNVGFLSRVLQSVPDRVQSEELRVKKSVSKDIATDEIYQAKSLLDGGNIRAAGTITGVALERHLVLLCETSNEELDFDYLDGITSLAHTLNDANEIQDDDLRLLEYLSGIRNKCSHASEEEPDKREVERMINQSEEFIQS